jgi:putative ABC transport system permease protein
MNFVLNMAWREMRASWYRLLLFFLCIAIGVGSIVSLRSLVQNLKKVITNEARSFFGGDVRTWSNQPWSEEARAVYERAARSPLVLAQTEIIETETMARSANDAFALPYMIQVRAVQERFPLYGEVKLTDGAPYSHALLEGRGVLVQSGLLHQLDLKVGDSINIGQLSFTIRGVMEFLPANEMQFAPIQRVLMDYADFEAAGLSAFGSRVNYSQVFKTPEGGDNELAREMARQFRELRRAGKPQSLGLGSFRYQQNFMTETLKNNESFLGVVGLAILMLGGIGIASVTRVFVGQKMKTIAILKCLGGENRQVLGAYFVQVLALSLVGSVLGLVLASIITHVVPRYAAGRFPVRLVPGLSWPAVAQGVAIGMLVTLLFALPPLLEIRQVKPILVLRQGAEGRRRFDRLRLAAIVLAALALLALTFWQSGSFKQGGVFLGFLIGTTLVLNAVGAALMYLLRRMRRLPSFVLRQGIGSLYRPGNQTKVILFTVGLGALFTISIRLQQAIVEREFAFELDASTADVYVVDVQSDQRAAVEALLTRLSSNAPLLIPIVQGRIVGINYDPANLKHDLAERELRNRLGWERRYSYRSTLEPNEKIIAGKFWGPGTGPEPEISMEERYAQDLQLGVGDKLTFDFLGKQIEAQVTSIRHLERGHTPASYLTRFNVLFRPGTLEIAPQTFIGAVKGPPPGAARAKLQREFVEQFPNITLVDAFETIAELRKRLGEISFVVSFVGGFVFLCGVLILAGSVAMTKYQRMYEAAILKTLGAEKKLIVCITLVEYGVLGLLAGLIGSSAAIGLTWALSKTNINIPWRFVPSINLLGVAMTLLLVAAVGVLSSWDVIMKKPLGILRAE